MRRTAVLKSKQLTQGLSNIIYAASFPLDHAVTFELNTWAEEFYPPQCGQSQVENVLACLSRPLDQEPPSCYIPPRKQLRDPCTVDALPPPAVWSVELHTSPASDAKGGTASDAKSGGANFRRVLDLIDAGKVESVAFYDRCQVMVYASPHQSTQRTSVVHLPQGSLTEIVEKLRQHKVPMVSHLGKKYEPPPIGTLHNTGECRASIGQSGHSIDDDGEFWEFLQTHLHTMLDQMQLQASEIYQSFVVSEPDAEGIDSLHVLSDESRTKAVQSVAEDTVKLILSSVSSHKAQEVLNQYVGCMHTMVETRVTDMFASVERSIVQSNARDKTSGIRSKTFPSSMRAKPC